MRLGSRAGRGGICLLVGLLLAGCDFGGRTTGTATPAAPATVPATPAGGTPVSLKESPFTGYLAPDFTLTDLDGHTVRLHDYRGHPVWINLWATWCVPCQTEMPEMQKLYTRYHSKGLVVLGVNAQEDPSRVAGFVREHSFGWQFLLDPDSMVQRKYTFNTVPSHVFVDKAGVIRAISVGGLAPADMETYLASIIGSGPGG